MQFRGRSSNKDLFLSYIPKNFTLESPRDVDHKNIFSTCNLLRQVTKNHEIHASQISTKTDLYIYRMVGFAPNLVCSYILSLSNYTQKITGKIEKSTFQCFRTDFPNRFGHLNLLTQNWQWRSIQRCSKNNCFT